MDPLTILGIGKAAGGLISSLFGGGQKRKGKKLLDSLKYANYDIPKEVLENQDLARARANSGLPSSQYAQATQNIQRNRNNAIRTASDRRGALMAITGANRATNDAMLGLDVADAQQKLQNERQLMDVNQVTAGYRDKKWQNDVKDKYDRDYNYAMSLMGVGQQNQMNGIDKGLGGLSLFGAGLLGKQNNYGTYGTPQTMAQPPVQSGSSVFNDLSGGRRMVYNPLTGQYELRY